MRVFEAKLVYSLVSLGDEVRLEQPETVVEYLRSAFDEHPMQEAFYCVYLDRRGHPLGRHLVTLGTVDSTLVSAREVFPRGDPSGSLCSRRRPPSGVPTPSTADSRVTRNLREAAKVIEIELLDHVIVGDPKADQNGLGYYSFSAGRL